MRQSLGAAVRVMGVEMGVARIVYTGDSLTQRAGDGATIIRTASSVSAGPSS
jgi:hypothetical protein